MGRYPWPPHDFECAYRHNCPYLDMLSTTWVLGEYRRANEVYQEHLRIMDNFSEELDAREKRIRELERENAELKAKYQAMHRRQFKSSRKKEEASNTREPEKRKKRGAKVGHPGWFRPKPGHIDRTVNVPAPTYCPHCRSEQLAPIPQTTEHIQEDIDLPPSPVVTRYVHRLAYCSKCGKPVSQAGPDEMPGAHIGPRAKATAIYLRQDIGITYRKMERIFRELFGLSFVPASAVGFDRRATFRGTPIYEDVRDKIRVSNVVHADETSWRNDGLGHFAWYAGNENLAYFHIDRHRSKDVAKAILDDFRGVLVRDRYAAYNGIGSDWQACLAHISRNAKDIVQEHDLLPSSQRDTCVPIFTQAVKEFCSEACDVGRQIQSEILPWNRATQKEKQLIRKLNGICKQPLGFKQAETLRNFLVGPEQKHLFTFLRHPGVPTTNNQAEQSIRRMVIFRKISFGTRSLSGIRTHSVLPSLVLTAKRQGIDPREFLRILLTQDTATAQAALYRNSS